MAIGNTFGATALSSYGGFWISFAILLTPGGFDIAGAYSTSGRDTFEYAVGFFLFGWFIFTTLLLVCTLRSTIAFFLIFFFLDLAFLLLAIGYIRGPTSTSVNVGCIKAGGVFGLLSAFAAWYNALAGLADSRYVTPLFILGLHILRT
jgi:succinate-acetate transporter protein